MPDALYEFLLECWEKVRVLFFFALPPSFLLQREHRPQCHRLVNYLILQEPAKRPTFKDVLEGLKNLHSQYIKIAQKLNIGGLIS
jgi:hypothetical protein